jgi:uncharacterized RDD family membrane protein YckC
MDDDTAVEPQGTPAGFWRRFGSSFVDGVALWVVSIILRIVGIESGASTFSVNLVGGYGVGLLVSLIYFTFFHGSTGQTPGDAALGIRIVDGRTGTVIGYPRAAVRWLVSILSVIPIFLGYFWMLWDSRKQTWHDKAAGSIPLHVGY